MLENEKNKTGLKKWLDTIQQDSWQLELVISGILIFLLIGAYEPISGISRPLSIKVATGGSLLSVMAALYAIFKISYFALMGVFLLHLLLRGFWIGAIGLRSISGDFDFDVLSFQPRFTGWLRGQLGTFDDYIERLEGQCSVAFSMAFMLFFSIVSLGLYTAFVIALMLSLNGLLGWLGVNNDANADSLLLAHASLLRLYRNDSLLPNPEWRFYEHPLRKQPGLVCDLPVYDLRRGRHELRVDRRGITIPDSTSWSTDATITFVR